MQGILLKLYRDYADLNLNFYQAAILV